MSIFTNKDFYPTPLDVLCDVLQPYNFKGKTILEPSAGNGAIVDYLAANGALNIIGCENNADLKKIVQNKCYLIADDFLTLEAWQVSHIDFIVMNPPFSADEKHILHAWEIAPDGCKIVALCNSETINNTYTRDRRRLERILNEHGYKKDLGAAFANADRKTDVSVTALHLQKPGETKGNEWDGFYLDEDIEAQDNSIMSYNFIRDVVNRYIGAVKIYEEQQAAAVRMNELTGSFFAGQLALSFTEKEVPKLKAEYKKDLQKSAWHFIFKKLNLEKISTRSLKADINKQAETQVHIPFTMRNIYHLIDMVIQTTGQRMDKAILDVFDNVTKHHEDNRHGLEGWKSNSHYLMTKKFVLPWMARSNYSSGWEISYQEDRYGIIDDLNKALCFITGKKWEEIGSVWGWSCSDHKREYNTWYNFGFFRMKAFKKQSMHFEFLDADVWAKFNQHVARLKGYPLFEGKEQTAYQKRNSGY